MTAPRSSTRRAMVGGALLVAAGLAFWALYVNRSGSEPHSYSRSAPAPATVRLVSGHTYGIAIPGGVNAELRAGLNPASLQCSAARTGEAPGALALKSVEQTGSKATDRIASFVSKIDGVVEVQCVGIGRVYVDNAADASFDWSGLWLVLASIALLVGLPLTLSALRSAGQAPPSAPDVERVDPAAADLL